MDLRQMRDRAGLSQEQLGTILGLSQAQISRYESNAKNAPIEVVFLWVQACGTTIAELSFEPAPGPATIAAIDVGEPYAGLEGNLSLLEQYVSLAPGMPTGVDLFGPTPAALRKQILAWRQRPTVVLTGRFDAGKSRIANSLLRSNELPAQYQPTTAVRTFVRHMDQRPAWQRDNVWVLGDDFNPENWADEEHCRAALIATGDYALLKKFTRGVFGEEKQAKAALVYVDAPLLRSCGLLDLPGYADDSPYTETASDSIQLGSVFLYVSPVNGFLDAQDFVQIGLILREMAKSMDPASPLQGLYIIASHAHAAVTPEELQQAMSRGAERLHRHLKDGILAELRERGISLSPNDFRARMFPFWYETTDRRQEFETDIAALLGKTLPRQKERIVDHAILKIREAAPEYYRHQIASYQAMIRKIAEARTQLQVMNDTDAEWRQRFLAAAAEVMHGIAAMKNESQVFLDIEIAPRLTPAALEQYIRENFDTRVEAQKYAPVKWLEDCQSQVDRKLKAQTSDFAATIETFLGKIGGTAFDFGSGPTLDTTLPFDVKGVFWGAAAGIGSLGALGIAAMLAGNLGGYILVAEFAGLLSSIGLSVSSVGLVSLVAAMGGPIVIAIGLATALFVGAKLLFGDSWQRRLAKRLSEQLENFDFLGKTDEAIGRYWAETAKAFRTTAEETMKARQNYAQKLKELFGVNLNDRDSHARIQRIVDDLEALKSFFAMLPWRSCS